jgi:hypothetical protein
MTESELVQLDPGHLGLTGFEVRGQDTFIIRYLTGGFTLISRTHLKRPIMAVEERHANKKNVLGGV